MKFVLFYHSLISDWNHGNAHFLRGIACELLARGHRVDVYEPADGWSLQGLRAEQGEQGTASFHQLYPQLSSRQYRLESFDCEQALAGADVVLVHEWNEPELIGRIGRCRAQIRRALLFHDTHHRSVTEPQSLARLDLRNYSGVLAFGASIAERYSSNAWAERTWVWHEAADTRRFHPLRQRNLVGDMVWVGNWGDEERNAELHEFLIDPAAELCLRARVCGVRYPEHALQALRAAGIEYGGWIANAHVPLLFSQYRCTVHVPRRAYARLLTGVPTIRMFEALACGIPLISAPWEDSEQLFRAGLDYLVARNGQEMKHCLREVLHDAELARSLAAHGWQTIWQRHTCAHRVSELLNIVHSLAPSSVPVSSKVEACS